MAVTPSVYVFQ